MDENLLRDLQSGSVTRRRAAAYKLGKTRDPDVVLHLIKAYNDPDPTVRQNVIDALHNIPTDEAQRFLNFHESDRRGIAKQVQQTGSVTQIRELVPQSPLSEPSPESVEHFERALEMWNEAAESEWADDLKLDIASELALAVHKAGAPFPRAYTLLATLFNELGDDKRAGYYANKALLQNPNAFYAQLVRIDVELKGVKIVNLRAGDFIALDDTLEGAYFGSVGKSISSLASAARAGVSQAKFRSEVDRLAFIFKSLCKAGVGVDEYLDMAGTLINLGDFARGLPFSVGQCNLYATVAKTPVDNINMTGREQDVAHMRRKAAGRRLLFKS